MSYAFPRELVYIDTQTASSSSSISFTSGISTNFKTFLVKIRNLNPSSNAANILLTFSTNGGSSYLSTNYNYYDFFVTNALGNDSATGTSSIHTFSDVSSTAKFAINEDITLYNFSNSVQVKSVYYQYMAQNGTPVPVIVEGYGNNTGTTAVNAIKFAPSAGTFTTGNFYLYGVNE